MAFERSRLVLVNEAHDGLRRCVRTRQIGARLINAAGALGVRHLAMEALHNRGLTERANRERRLPRQNGGYLAQPEMRDLIALALQLGWTLLSYEADMARKPPGLANLSTDETNWREQQQAQNLAEAFCAIHEPSGLLVRSGNHHLAKHPIGGGQPMGSRLQALCGTEPFAIDQTPTIVFDETRPPVQATWASTFAEALDEHGGTACFRSDEAPRGWACCDLADAFLLSTENRLS